MAKAKKPHSSAKTKIYSTRDVRLGSIVGGPWAATYFFYKNFKAVNQPAYAQRTLMLGILSPVVLGFVGLAFPAQNRQFFLIAIYIGIIIFLVQRYQGAVMRATNKSKTTFYSESNASAVTLVLFIAYILAFFGLNLTMNSNTGYTKAEVFMRMFVNLPFDVNAYNAYIVEFTDNGHEIQTIYAEVQKEAADPSKKDNVLANLDKVLALTEENKTIVGQMEALKNPTPKIKEKTGYLKSYVNDVSETMGLVRKSIAEDTTSYTDRITELSAKSVEEYKNFEAIK